MAQEIPLGKLREMVGREIGRSGWFSIDQERVNAFADCTEDHQWIHVDAAKAAAGPFGRTIAHGFLVLSLIPHFSRQVSLAPEGASMTINYGLNRVRFINPVPVGARVRDIIVLGELTEKGAGRILATLTHTIEIEGEERPACVAETLSMFFV